MTKEIIEALARLVVDGFMKMPNKAYVEMPTLSVDFDTKYKKQC